jgi:hypothetical protein
MRVYSKLSATILMGCATLSFIGCPSDRTKSAEPPATCAKSGDPCTFSPGKLGLCIESVDGKLVCQSQH